MLAAVASQNGSSLRNQQRIQHECVRMGFLDLLLEPASFSGLLVSDWIVVIQHGETSDRVQAGQIGNDIERHRFRGDFCLLAEGRGGTRDSVCAERMSSEILWNHRP